MADYAPYECGCVEVREYFQAGRFVSYLARVGQKCSIHRLHPDAPLFKKEKNNG